jgi:hypothetical protein
MLGCGAKWRRGLGAIHTVVNVYLRALSLIAVTARGGPEQVRVSLRENGDLGEAAEQLLAIAGPARPATVDLVVVGALDVSLDEIAERKPGGLRVVNG